jgi:hypothetical protein
VILPSFLSCPSVLGTSTFMLAPSLKSFESVLHNYSAVFPQSLHRDRPLPHCMSTGDFHVSPDVQWKAYQPPRAERRCAPCKAYHTNYRSNSSSTGQQCKIRRQSIEKRAFDSLNIFIRSTSPARKKSAQPWKINTRTPAVSPSQRRGHERPKMYTECCCPTGSHPPSLE